MSQLKECTCKSYNAKFYEYASRIKEGRGIYCSKACFYKEQNTSAILICKECNGEFVTFQSQMIKGRQFCCKKCVGSYTKKHSNSTQYGRFFHIYSGIRNRCNVSMKDKDYIVYQRNGIKCLWKTFDEFKDNMYESYLQHVDKHGIKETSIDRISNSGNYCKENCRWATSKEQANNRGISMNLVFDNNVINYYDFAKRIGRSITTVYRHLKCGKSPEEIYRLSLKYNNKGKKMNNNNHDSVPRTRCEVWTRTMGYYR